MKPLCIYNEDITSNLATEMLVIISLISIICGILVIITNNPVVSVLFLIGLFSSISTYLIMLGLCFIGLSYLLVYIGAVSILFLFILMLINVRVSELSSNAKNSIPLAIVVCIAFYFAILSTLPYTLHNYGKIGISGYGTDIFTKNGLYNYSNNTFGAFMESNIKEINFSTSNIWDGNITEISHIAGIGNIMYTSYSTWLIITSLILLLAMIGVIVITVKNKQNS